MENANVGGKVVEKAAEKVGETMSEREIKKKRKVAEIEGEKQQRRLE